MVLQIEVSNKIHLQCNLRLLCCGAVITWMAPALCFLQEWEQSFLLVTFVCPEVYNVNFDTLLGNSEFFYVLRVGDFQGIFSEIKNISGFFWWKRWQCPMQEMVLKSSATFFIVLKRGFGYQINKITSICILTYSILIGRRLSTTECHEICVIILFHESKPSGPLI